jgi:hypothetical protein
MHWQPHIRARAPAVVGQPDGPRRGARRAPLAQALVRHPAMGETHQEPALPPGAAAAPRQTPERRRRRATSPRRVPYHRAIQAGWRVCPRCRKRHCWRLRRGPPSTPRLLTAPPWPGLWRPLPPWASTRLCGATRRGVGLRLTGPRRRGRATIPPTWRSAAGSACQPAVSHRGSGRARATPGAMRGAAVAGVRGPQSPPRQRRRPPCHLWRTQFRMGLIPWHALPIHGRHALPMGRGGPLGRHALQALDRRASHGPAGRGPLRTAAPSLPLPPSYDGVCGELTAGHQGARPCGALLGAGGAAQPFDLLVGACPGPRRAVAFARRIAPHPPWIRA